MKGRFELLYFASDYMEGATPEIISGLSEINQKKFPGYGTDEYCALAAGKIRKACDCPQASVYFTVGGTQTNAAVIGGILKSWQGVVCAASGHINTHEAGAIEHSGHKVITLPEHDGKICPGELKEYLDSFFADENREHMTEPGMVYISHPTEYGTLYTAEELRQLHEVCSKWEIPLYMDGARLGYGLVSPYTDVDLMLIAKMCDIFYIGGTKTGALFGEAVVVPEGKYLKRFPTILKQYGGLLAKGWLIGFQFDILFTDGLYLKIARHGVDLAQKLQKALKEAGYTLMTQSPTNQIFVILNNSQKDRLKELVSFSFWERLDEEHTAVRFALSWASKEKDVDELICLMQQQISENAKK